MTSPEPSSCSVCLLLYVVHVEVFLFIIMYIIFIIRPLFGIVTIVMNNIEKAKINMNKILLFLYFLNVNFPLACMYNRKIKSG